MVQDGQETGWLVEGGRGQTGCAVCHSGNSEVGDFDIVQSNSLINYFSAQVSSSATNGTESNKFLSFMKTPHSRERN